MNTTDISSMHLEQLFNSELPRHIKRQGDLFRQAKDIFTITLSENNGFPERTVSKFLISALADTIPNSHQLLELPLTDTETSRHHHHIDAIIFNEDICVLAEFKRFYFQRHWDDLATDAARARRVADGISGRFADKRRRRFFLFLGADCLYQERVKFWRGETLDRLIYKAVTLPQPIVDLHRDSLLLWEDKAKGMDSYSWLWAWGEISLAAN